MSEQDDRVFLKRFSMVIAGLVIFTIVIIFLALTIHRETRVTESPAREIAREERLQPAAGVHSGQTAQAVAEAAPEATAEPESAGAFDGSLDGELIYQRACAACHNDGVAGAPRLLSADWGDRLGKGTDELVASAISGIGAMPPKGGRGDLTDEQVEVSVMYMLDQLE